MMQQCLARGHGTLQGAMSRAYKGFAEAQGHWPACRGGGKHKRKDGMLGLGPKREAFPEGGVVQLNPEEAVIRKGSPGVIKGTVASLEDLNSGQNPNDINRGVVSVSVLGCRGRSGAIEVKDRVTKEAHALKKKGKWAGLGITVVVNAKNNIIPGIGVLLNGVCKVMVKLGEGFRQGEPAGAQSA